MFPPKRNNIRPFLLYPPNNLDTVPNMHLFLQDLDLYLLVVDLVILLLHSIQQLKNALLLAVDHILPRKIV